MDEPLIISIDQGTTSARAVVFTQHTLPVTAHQVELRQIIPAPGFVEHDPYKLVEGCITCIEEVCVNLEDKKIPLSSVKALGIANQRETAVLWDQRTGEPVYNAIVWSDTRTNELVKEMQARPEASRVRELCGLHLDAYFAATKIRWLLDNNEKVRRVYEERQLCFGTVDTWLIYALSGKKVHITDASNASRSMFMNISNVQYDPELIKFFGVEKLILPEIRSSSEIYGHLDLPNSPVHGLPIAGCVGDQSSALVGQLGFECGDVKNTYGTGCFLMYNTGHEPVLSDKGLLTTIAYQLPGEPPSFALEGSIAVCGSVIKWLKNNLGVIETNEQVGDLIESVADSAGVYFVTAFGGLFSPYWRPDARGTIVGITSYTNKAHITRAAIEAILYQTREIFELMDRETGTKTTNAYRTLKVDGGLTSSDIIMQLQADLGGFEVVRPPMREPTALGAAIMAGLAVGVWESLEDVKKKHNMAVGRVARFSPRTNSESRDAAFAQWHRAVERAVGWLE